MNRLVFLFSVCLVVAPLTLRAQLSDVVCDDSERLEKQLFGTKSATKHGRGMRGPDALIEVWIEPNSGDWTLVQSYPNGTSCVVAMGEHWEVLTPDRDPA